MIGSGGREHAIAWKISQSPRLSKLFCAPGNAGTARLGTNIPISASDNSALLDFARSERIDLTVVGPEPPLVGGLADLFRRFGLPVTGPSASAARLEGSKVFAKEFMKRHRIPCAASATCDTAAQALSILKEGRFSFPLVVKAEGLAAGKGVFVCPDPARAVEAVDLIMRQRRFGASGNRVLIEEFLEGTETSFMVFSDGESIVPLALCQDHKAVFDHDQGPNTGGMGACSADHLLPESLQHQILEQVISPTIEGMAREGSPFDGILYAGLMLTANGPRVLEFNVRLGDPETQAILPRLESDLLEVYERVARRELSGLRLNWSSRCCVCVVLASQGYPGSYQTGKEISGLEMAEEDPDTIVFHAGTASRNGTIVTAGGRVLIVTSLASSLEGAIMKAYEGVNKIHFEGMHYRRDIASKQVRERKTE